MKTDTVRVPSPRNAVHRSRAGARLLVLTVAMLAGALALEGAARVVFDRNGMHYGVEMWKYARTLKRQSANPEIGHEHVPNSRARLMGTDVQINSQGLRNPELGGARRPDVRRLLVLGDSLTFGWGVEEHETYSRILEGMLAGSGRRYEVVNAGVGNYNTSQQVAWFAERGVTLEADEVILGFYINDAEPTPRKTDGWLANRSYLYVVFTSTWDALQRRFGMKQGYAEYYASLYDETSAGWQAWRAAFEQLVALCRTHGTALRVVLLPELHEVEDTYPFRFIHERVGAVSARHGVPVLDLNGAFRGHSPKTLWVSPGDAHPNALAHRIIASRLREAITVDWSSEQGEIAP